MKVIVKIILLCIVIFGISVFITKKTIDYTFQKLQCEQAEAPTSIELLYQTREV